jgi:hypothetical protein
VSANRYTDKKTKTQITLHRDCSKVLCSADKRLLRTAVAIRAAGLMSAVRIPGAATSEDLTSILLLRPLGWSEQVAVFFAPGGFCERPVCGRVPVILRGFSSTTFKRHGRYNTRLHLTALRESCSRSGRAESPVVAYSAAIGLGSSVVVPPARVSLFSATLARDSPRPERTRGAAGEPDS